MGIQADHGIVPVNTNIITRKSYDLFGLSASGLLLVGVPASLTSEKSPGTPNCHAERSLDVEKLNGPASKNTSASWLRFDKGIESLRVGTFLGNHLE